MKVQWTNQGNELQIPLSGDFSFNLCLGFLNRNPQECLHQVTSQNLLKLLVLSQGPILLEIKADTSNLLVRPLNRSLAKLEESEVADYVTHLFDLDRDLQPFYTKMAGDPLLAKVVSQLRGLRIIGIPNLFEALCWSVIGQQINLNFAYTLKRRLVVGSGDSLTWKSQDFWVFPSPGQVLQIPDEQFVKWQFSKGKQVYIKGIAAALAEGVLNKRLLMDLAPADAYNRLIELKGIGPWSAQYVLMKCLRQTDAYPMQDVGLHNALKLAQGNAQKPNLSELEAFGASWDPWQAYVTFYLWHTLIKTT